MHLSARSSAFFLLVSSCCVAPVVAKADTFSFAIDATQPSQVGVYLTSSGTLTATPDASVAGAFDVTSITGTVNNVAIAGLVTSPAPTVTFPDTFTLTYDNLLFPSAAAPFDIDGLAFTDANGVDYNIFDIPGSGLAYESFDGNISFDQQTIFNPAVNVTLTDETAVTPEPSSLLLLGTGLLGMTVLLRRRIA